MDEKGKKVKKVGADGLTKKERRALKVEAEKKIDISNTKLNIRNEVNPSGQHKILIEELSIKNLPQLCTSPLIKSESKKEFNSTECVKSLNEGTKTQKLKSIQHDKKQLEPNLNATSEKIVSLTKAELRSQRRALQEVQRVEKNKLVNHTINDQKVKDNAKVSIQKLKEPTKQSSIHKVQLFNHLYVDSSVRNLKNYMFNKEGVHPAFLRLGVQYLSKSILGSNARCLAMLSALKYLINDFKTPPKQEFCRSLESTLQTCIAHLNYCRPLAVSMTNALRYFKLSLTQIKCNVSDNDKRSSLQERIDNYIQEQLGKAGEAISNEVKNKILDNDIILIYGYSSLIQKILVDAHKTGKKFRVIVLDSRPMLEGREMLRRLVCADIQCSYLLINAVSFVMSGVTKVLLGAHALLANGYVMSRTGTAQVALVANAYKKPVLVCCETYKFCERAQMDSFVYNEIADPDQLITAEASEKSSCLLNWRDSAYLIPLNIMYDVTPSDLVTAVVTEIAVLPCTSVPVILRIKPVE